MEYNIHFEPDTNVVFSEESGSIWVVNKPLRWTSFDVINKLKFQIRKQTGLKKFKIGHAGTLDPLAEGVLLVCLGKATKEIEKLQSLSKIYAGTFVLGATTASYDLEQAVENEVGVGNLTAEDVTNACKKFIGNQKQIPPVFSAVKVGGKSAFKYARKGENLELKEREINIYSFEISRVEFPEVDFEIKCSKGTYIRAVARDFGESLGCGAYLKSLKRTAIGNYLIENALPLNDFFASSPNLDCRVFRKKNFDL